MRKSRVTQEIQNNIRFCNILLLSGSRVSECFFTNSQDVICSKKLYAQFLEIHRFTTFLSQPALLCRFQELMNWRGVRSTTRPPVWITQDYWRATTEGVDQQHCRWFLTEILIQQLKKITFWSHIYSVPRTPSVLSKQWSQMFFECRIQYPTTLSDV